jgi:hypothetical protein
MKKPKVNIVKSESYDTIEVINILDGCMVRHFCPDPPVMCSNYAPGVWWDANEGWITIRNLTPQHNPDDYMYEKD